MKYEPNNNTEQAAGVERSFAELLPRYYEAYGTNPTYEVEQSMPVDGHDVAWMRYQGEVVYDMTGKGQEGTAYTGCALYCACKFTEGVGWRIDETNGTPVGLIGGDECAKKEQAVHLRHLELRREYQEKGLLARPSENNPEALQAIMLDLIAKREAGEFLEGSSGAEFWGGHYYLQTVGEITGLAMKHIWPAVDQLRAEKRIRLEGMVVQTYREPYQAETYNAAEVPEPAIHYEKPDKVWALVPRPEETELDLSETIDTDNRQNILGRCIVGLAHTAELAEARLTEAITNPRVSHERLYQQSFVESAYKAGALAVIAYTARTNDQAEEWVVEGFVGDAVVPEVHTLRMDYPTVFGIDGADYDQLNRNIEAWWPA